MKRLLLSTCLLFMLSLGWLGFTTQGFKALWWVADAVFPGSLSTQVEGTLLGTWRLQALEYQSEGLTLHLSSLLLDWQPQALLNSQLLIQQLQLGELDLWLPGSTSGEEQPPALSALPFMVELQTLRLPSLRVHQDTATILAVDDLEMHLVGRETLTVELRAQTSGALLDTRGELHLETGLPMDLHLHWQIPMAEQPLIGEGTVLGRYDQHIHLSQTLSGAIQGELRGTVEVSDTPRWALTGLFEGDPGLWVADWPGDGVVLQWQSEGSPEVFSLAGEIHTRVPTLEHLSGDFLLERQAAAWTLRGLALGSSEGDLALDIQGDLDPLAAILTLQGSWQALGWPLDVPTMGSQAGRLQLSGSPADYHFEITGDWWHESLGQGQMQINGDGDHHEVRLQRLQLKHREETVAHAQASLRHDDGFVQIEGDWAGLPGPPASPLRVGPGKLRLSGYLPLPELP